MKLKEKYHNLVHSKGFRIASYISFGLNFLVALIVILALALGGSGSEVNASTLVKRADTSDFDTFTTIRGTFGLNNQLGYDSTFYLGQTNDRFGDTFYLIPQKLADGSFGNFNVSVEPNGLGTDGTKLPASYSVNPSETSTPFGIAVLTQNQPGGSSGPGYIDVALIPYALGEASFRNWSVGEIYATTTSNHLQMLTFNQNSNYFSRGGLISGSNIVLGGGEARNPFPIPRDFDLGVNGHPLGCDYLPANQIAFTFGTDTITNFYCAVYGFRFYFSADQTHSPITEPTALSLSFDFSFEMLEQSAYEMGYADGAKDGYDNGYQIGVEVGKSETTPINSFMGTFTGAFDAVAGILRLEIFGIPLSTFLFIPLAVMLILFVVGLFKAG